jgi:hypothetical protein
VGASQFSRLVHAAEVRELEPVREQVERRAAVPDLRDVFLCHAWDDRQGAAKELHDLLEARGVKVWFSEKDIALGEPFLREIDRGLALPGPPPNVRIWRATGAPEQERAGRYARLSGFRRSWIRLSLCPALINLSVSAPA